MAFTLARPADGNRNADEGDPGTADVDGREELDERRGIERLGSDPVAERDFGDDCYGFGGSVETELDVHLLVWGGVRDR